MSKKLKKLGKAIALGAVLSGMGGSKTLSKTLTGETVKKIPVTVKSIASPEIENISSLIYERPKTLKGGGAVMLGKNVDEDLL
jgi:hypothetical protein|tara:strand:+ start:582 stop:830 length:249 start_codon:yes stop_codon:yes gene_type:complete